MISSAEAIYVAANSQGISAKIVPSGWSNKLFIPEGKSRGEPKSPTQAFLEGPDNDFYLYLNGQNYGV